MFFIDHLQNKNQSFVLHTARDIYDKLNACD